MDVSGSSRRWRGGQGVDSCGVLQVVIQLNAYAQTSLLIKYTTNIFPTDYIPTVFDTHTAHHWVNKTDEYHIDLFDASGGEYYNRLRPLLYPSTDIFLLCFSVVEHASFENIRTIWAPEVAHHLPSAAVLVVGTKTDLCDDATTLDALHDRHTAPIQRQQGVALCKEIGAGGYVECSSRTGFGIRAVFEEAIKLVVSSSERKVPESPRRCVIM
uniref:Uncharacterized protein n=1 Tax=Psilocybe cubensis TaxID=181762 RepID=A0A8H7XZU8_PSICU